MSEPRRAEVWDDIFEQNRLDAWAIVKQLKAENQRLRAVAEAAKRWRETQPKKPGRWIGGSPAGKQEFDAGQALVAAVDALARPRTEEKPRA